MAVVIFILLTLDALSADHLAGEPSLTREVQELSFRGLPTLEDSADVIGSSLFLACASLCLGLLFALLRDYPMALLATAVVPLRTVGLLFKLAIERPRPSPPAVVVRESAAGFGFPSGHALGAALLFGVIVIAAEHYLTGVTRRVVQSLALVAALLVGAERIYGGVHWPSDVVGGYLLGVLILGAASAFLFRPERLRRDHAARVRPRRANADTPVESGRSEQR